MKIASALVLAILLPLSAAAQVPCPELSNVPRCLLASPNGSLEYKVTIILPRGPGCTGLAPMAGDVIQVRFSPVGDTLICYCLPSPGPRPAVLTALTNASGVAVFHLAGGGCAQPGIPAFPGAQGFVAEIFANGIKMQEAGLVSPDAVDSNGRTALDSPGWNPSGACAAGLADAVEHTGPLAGSLYSWCSDMNCDNQVSIADAVLMTPNLADAASCSGDAGP